MIAVYAKRYGSPSDLHIGEVPTPNLRDSHKHRSNVLIRVHAAGVHVGDCFTVRGKPFVVRMETGWLQPSAGIPGYDFSGVVEDVGKSVTGFDVGDEVFGYYPGSCAEFVGVRHVRRTNDQRPSGRFEMSLADGELGASLEDMKDFVVRMHVQVGAFADLIGAVADDDAIDAEVMSFLGPQRWARPF